MHESIFIVGYTLVPELVSQYAFVPLIFSTPPICLRAKSFGNTVPGHAHRHDRDPPSPTLNGSGDEPSEQNPEGGIFPHSDFCWGV